MKLVFADTCYWIALANPSDNLHEAGRAVSGTLGKCRIVTTEMVLAKFANGLSKYGEGLRTVVAEIARSLKKDPNVEVVPQTSLQFQHAMDQFESRSDKRWSLTDCASFILMQERSISHALTQDHHFEQAGFRKLL